MATTLENAIHSLKIGTSEYILNPKYLGGNLYTDYALKRDLVGLLNYKGSIPGSATSPANNLPAAPEKGDVYAVSSAGYVGTTKCEAGDMLIYNGTSWDFVQGNIDLATLDAKYAVKEHKHNISGTTYGNTVTISGTISNHTFDGEEGEHNHETEAGAHNHTFFGDQGDISVKGKSAVTVDSHTFTPSGKIDMITHTPGGSVAVEIGGTTGTDYTPGGNIEEAGEHAHNVAISYIPEGDVTFSIGDGPANYTPGGNISGGTHKHEVNISYTPEGEILSAEAHSHTATLSGTFTPTGNITNGEHNHAVTVSPTSDEFLTSAIGAGTFSGSYDNGVLTLAHTDEITIGKADALTAVEASTGNVVLSFAGDQGTVTVTGTTEDGGAHNHDFRGTAKNVIGNTNDATPEMTFEGTGVDFVFGFTGTDKNVTGTTADAGAHAHDFKGTATKIGASFTGHKFEVVPVFRGNEETLVHTVGNGDIISAGKFTPSGSISNNSAYTVTVKNAKTTPKGTISVHDFSLSGGDHTHTFSGKSGVEFKEA